MRTKLTTELTSPRIINYAVQKIDAVAGELVAKLERETNNCDNGRVGHFDRLIHRFSLEG